jgi:hypothetical protein
MVEEICAAFFGHPRGLLCALADAGLPVRLHLSNKQGGDISM